MPPPPPPPLSFGGSITVRTTRVRSVSTADDTSTTSPAGWTLDSTPAGSTGAGAAAVRDANGWTAHEVSVYGFLLALRLLCAISLFGYIHPDEFFQSPEITAGDVLGVYHHRSWEWSDDWNQTDAGAGAGPIRSVLFPYLSTGFGFAALRAFDSVTRAVCGVSLVTGWTIFVVPRICMFAYSLLFDYLLHRICVSLARSSAPVLLVSGTSWCVLVLCLRPFSNVAELLWTTILLAVIVIDRPIHAPTTHSLFTDRRPLAFGVILACGVFTRASFPAFAAPIGLLLLFDQWMTYRPPPPVATATTATDSAPAGGWQTPLYVVSCRTPLLVAGGFLCVSFALAVIDSLYFHTLAIAIADPITAPTAQRVTFSLHSIAALCSTLFGQLTRLIRASLSLAPAATDSSVFIPPPASVVVSGRLTIAPLNFLIYNSNPSNLALHGLHPRYTHATVNMILLFSVLYAAFVYTTTRAIIRRFTAVTDTTVPPPTPTAHESAGAVTGATSLAAVKQLIDLLPLLRDTPPRVKGVYACCACMIACGLLVLSIAPHQEPRFLLPLLTPLLVLHASTIYESPNAWRGWIATNAISALLFGGLHQSGITPALIQFSTAFSAADASGDAGLYHLPLTYAAPNEAAESTLAAAATAAGLSVAISSLDLIWFHAYMPPRSVLAFASAGGGDAECATDSAHRSLCVYDAGGGDTESLARMIERVLTRRFSLSTPIAVDGINAIAVVTPAPITESIIRELTNRTFCYTAASAAVRVVDCSSTVDGLKRSASPFIRFESLPAAKQLHLTLEDAPGRLADMNLNVHQLFVSFDS